MSDAMSANQVALWYLVASVCFILALKGLSHPYTARRGNLLRHRRHGDRACSSRWRSSTRTRKNVLP